MLHITNGESAATALRAIGVTGPVIAWNDVLHEGPVRALAPGAFRAERARFLASPDIDAAAIVRNFEARDAALEAAGHVVLWFEHDLYDQLQLAQVLSVVAGMPGTKVEGVLPDDYLGTQALDALSAWHDSRRAVTPGQVAAGQAAWRALCSDDPRAVERLWQNADADGALPHMGAALLRLLQQYPSVHNGLSRTQSQALSAVAGGVTTARELFVAANHRVEDAVFMGDTTWWRHLQPLITGARPLLTVTSDAAAWHLAANEPVSVAITDAGLGVLAGELDQIALNGINRWIGGVHLTPDNCWRWSAENLRVEPPC